MVPNEGYSYKNLTEGSTGSIAGEEEKLVVVSHGPYRIIVRVTEDGRFVDIDELQIDKDFLSPEQRLASSGYFDVAEFYEEE